MRLHDLKPAAGSRKDRKRLGRGNASGQGTTGGKGTKGEKARAGGLKAGFRGMSSRNFRLAKRRGFNNKFRVEFQPVNLAKVAQFPAGTTVNPDLLRTHGFVHGRELNVKILGDGELTVALQFEGVRVSSSAREKIEAAGGSIVPRPEREPQKRPARYVPTPMAAGGSPAPAPPVSSRPVQEQAGPDAESIVATKEASGDTSSA